MRNQNPDIIIHNLVNKAENRKRCKGPRYDAAEEMRIDEERFKDLQEKHDKQELKEAGGRFIHVENGSFKGKILVKEGEDEADRIKRFIEKLEKRFGI